MDTWANSFNASVKRKAQGVDVELLAQAVHGNASPLRQLLRDHSDCAEPLLYQLRPGGNGRLRASQAECVSAGAYRFKTKTS